MKNNSIPVHDGYLDSLRGVAILLVVMVHVGHIIEDKSVALKFVAQYGQFGVQLFFLVSAYTLSMAFVKNGDLLNFFCKRFFRIAPLYYLFIVVYFLLELNIDSRYFDSNYSFLNVLSNVFFVHAWFASANNSVVPGGWSIACEFAFYAFFPLVFKMVSCRPLSIWRMSLFVFAVCVLVAVLFMLFAEVFWGFEFRNNGFVYYSPFVQMFAFVSGVFLFFYERDFQFNPLGSTFLFFGFSIINSVFCAFGYFFDSRFFVVTPILSSCSFLFLFLILKKHGGWRWLAWLGAHSYGIYLSHFIFVYFVEWKVSFYSVFCAVLVASSFLSFLSKKYIEDYFIAIGRSIFSGSSNSI